MATLDELTVRIKADASQLEREMKRVGSVVEQSSAKIKSSLSVAGAQLLTFGAAFGVATVISYTKSVVNAAAALQDLADKTGVSATFLSSLKTEVENSGGSVDGLAQSIFIMNNAIGEAAKDAAGPVAQSFKKLGIDLEQLKRLTPEQQFYLVADAISKLGTGFEQTEAARNIFGRGVGTLLPLLKQGADGIKAVQKAADDAGDSLSNKQIAAVDRFGDAMNRLANTAGNNVVAAFAASILKIEELPAGLTNFVAKSG